MSQGIFENSFGDMNVAGDVITVRLDLDASAVALRKNGADVGSLAPDSTYHFAFEADKEGQAVTIVDETQ